MGGGERARGGLSSGSIQSGVVETKRTVIVNGVVLPEVGAHAKNPARADPAGLDEPPRGAIG